MNIEELKAKSEDELIVELGKAHKAGDKALMRQISKLITEKAIEEEKRQKAERDERLKAVETAVKSAIGMAVEQLKADGTLDDAEGIWYSYDFGDIEPTIRLTKKAAAAKSTTSSGSGGYISVDVSTKDLLEQVGSDVMFNTDTKRTIDKTEHVLPAGMTFEQAWKFSDNRGWRNQVRMAMLKAAKLV